MADLDDSIHDGLGSLTADAPEAPEWGDIEMRGATRRRRRTAVVAAVCAIVLLVAIAAIARVGDDDTTVVAGPTDTTCGAWIAVVTLIESPRSGGDGAAVGTLTPRQAALLVDGGDVRDRVSGQLGVDPADLAARVVARGDDDLGTIEMSAWAETRQEANLLVDTVMESLVASTSDIHQREIDLQRSVLSIAIAQLQLELTGVGGDDPAAVAQRDRLNNEINDKQVMLQEVDQQDGRGSVIYDFGSSESFQLSWDQLERMFALPVDAEASMDCAGTSATGSSSRTYVAHTAAWDREGERLREDKRKVADSPYNAGNAGDFAYQSLPVDIDAPGTYSLVVGPLDDWWADQPSTFVVNLPTDATFWATNWTNTGVVMGADGSRYLSMDLTIEPGQNPDRPFEPYPGMTIWIY